MAATGADDVVMRRALPRNACQFHSTAREKAPMASFPFDVVVFDLDGTLVDSSADLAAALNHVLARLGRPTADAATVRRLVGRGARVLIREGLALTGASSERLVDENYPVFIDYYAAHIRD